MCRQEKLSSGENSCQTNKNTMSAKPCMSNELHKATGLSRQMLKVEHTGWGRQTDKEEHTLNQVLLVWWTARQRITLLTSVFHTQTETDRQTNNDTVLEKCYMSDQLSKGAGISRQTLNVSHIDENRETDKEEHTISKVSHVWWTARQRKIC